MFGLDRPLHGTDVHGRRSRGDCVFIRQPLDLCDPHHRLGDQPEGRRDRGRHGCRGITGGGEPDAGSARLRTGGPPGSTSRRIVRAAATGGVNLPHVRREERRSSCRRPSRAPRKRKAGTAVLSGRWLRAAARGQPRFCGFRAVGPNVFERIRVLSLEHGVGGARGLPRASRRGRPAARRRPRSRLAEPPCVRRCNRPFRRGRALQTQSGGPLLRQFTELDAAPRAAMLDDQL